MGGPIRADWLFGERQLGFEGHRILRCKFTFTPEMSAKPLMNDVYERLPTNATQKLRKPHRDQVFAGSPGWRLHFFGNKFRIQIRTEGRRRPISYEARSLYCFPHQAMVRQLARRCFRGKRIASRDRANRIAGGSFNTEHKARVLPVLG